MQCSHIYSMMFFLSKNCSIPISSNNSESDFALIYTLGK